MYKPLIVIAQTLISLIILGNLPHPHRKGGSIGILMGQTRASFGWWDLHFWIVVHPLPWHWFEPSALNWIVLTQK